MGDKAYSNTIRKLRAGNLASAAGMRQARMAGFSSTTDLIDSIMGNAAGGVAGASAKLTRQNSRQLTALAALADRTRAGNARAVNGGQREAANLFGGAVAGLTAPEFGRAAGHSKAAQIALTGAARGAVTSARGGGLAMGIMAQGVEAAAAGAQAQTADALLYRAKNDAQIIADRQNMMLQAQLDFQNWKRQQDYLKKQEEGDKTGAWQGVSQVADTAVTASIAMQKELADNPDATVDDLIDAATAGNRVLAADEGAQQYLAQLASSLKSAPDTGTYAPTVDAIVDATLLLYPNFKNVKRLRETIDAGIRAGWNAETAKHAADQLAGGGDVQPLPGEDPNTAAGVPKGAEGAVGYNYVGQQYDSSTVRWVTVDEFQKGMSGWLLVNPNVRDSQGRVQVAKPRA